jgi:LCP family protein required for cell wall assembly
VSSASSSGKNVLIVGSDSRAGLTDEQQNELTTGSVEGDRTDTIMLLHIPTFGTPTLVSLPRDSWVPIPGFGSAKINAAYALGGPQLLITTVEQATGLEITDFVAVGFAGVANTTDALGGVTLCPVSDFNDELSGLNVSAGCQTMDGATALAYVRMRYQDPRGDLGRIERQQEFVAAVGRKALSPLTWLLPWRAFSTAHAAGEALTVSQGTNILDITRMGVAMAMISFGWGTSTTVPTEEASFDVDGQSALKWDSAAASELFAGLE